MERVMIFHQNIPLIEALADRPENRTDLPEAYDDWFKKQGNNIEVISRQFSMTGPLPGLDGGHVVMAIAVFYRLKASPNSDG